MNSKSSILIMLREKAQENRQICEFPCPYRRDCTPYNQIYFSDETRSVCFDNVRVFVTSLKMCKVIILGDVSVGKTCIVKRFCHEIFESGYKATIGVDFEVERFDILDVPFHLQIWDTAGQERFKCIAQSYYRSAHVVIVVFDFTSIATLSHCKTWLKEALSAAGNEHPFIFLVGTKKDMVAKAAFENIETSATKIAKYMNAEYWAVSSKTGENINELFYRIAAITFDDCIIKEKEKVNVNIESDLISFKKNAVAKSPKKIHCGEMKCKH